MMAKLFVFYNQTKVGELTKNRDATNSFSYSVDWLSGDQSFAISPVMELSDEKFDHRQTQSFFGNLLPERQIRERIEKLAGRSLVDGFQFLERYGVDCAGAFVITPDAEYPRQQIDGEVEKLDLKALSQVCEDNENLMAYVIKQHNGRFSLAGAQDKVPVIWYENELYVPTKGMATTHILKPPHNAMSVKDSVYNEYFVMKLGKSLGLNCPDVDIIEGRVPLYIIERFDRAKNKDQIERLHQLDFCQAQGYLASEKYEEDGGPALRDNYLCIRENSSGSIEDVERFLDWICFNILIGNNDCHSKNISFLWTEKGYRLAPFYDLLCTAIYSEYTSEFAFKLDNNRVWGQWQKQHFTKEMVSWELDKSQNLMLDTLGKMVEKLSHILDAEAQEFNQRFSRVRVANRIRNEIKTRCDSLSKRLQI